MGSRICDETFMLSLVYDMVSFISWGGVLYLWYSSWGMMVFLIYILYI